MKVGDLVKRKPGSFLEDDSIGLVINLYKSGRPLHRCANVLWGNSGKVYGIGCSRLIVVGHSEVHHGE